MHMSLTDVRKLLAMRFILQLQNMPCGHLVICCRVGVDEAKGYRHIEPPPSFGARGRLYRLQFSALVYLKLKYREKQRPNLCVQF